MGLQKNDNYYNITNWFFIIAILIFSITSLFHVTVFWLITNSLFLSVIMSIATGFGIISSLLSTKYTKLTYISFALIILIELFGNIYGSFIHIDVTSKYFLGWKELMEPVFSFFYTMEEGVAIPDVIYKRWAAIIQGSFIPLLLSITFHMWMVVRDKYHKIKSKIISPASNREIVPNIDTEKIMDLQTDLPFMTGVNPLNEKEGGEFSYNQDIFYPANKLENTGRRIFKIPLNNIDNIDIDKYIEKISKKIKEQKDIIEDPLENNQINEKEETDIQKEEIVQTENNDAKIEPQVTKEEAPDKKIESKPKLPGKGKMIKVKDKEIGNIYLKPENDK